MFNGNWVPGKRTAPVRGNMGILKSLRKLKDPDRIEIYKYVIKGRDKLLIARLDSAISELNYIHKKKEEEKREKREKKRTKKK